MARLLILLPLLAGASASASDMLSFSVDAFGSLSGSASGGASYNTSYVTASCFSGVGGMRISAGSAAWSTLLAPYLRAGAMACPAVTLPRPSPSLAPALASVVPAYLYASPPGGLTSDVLTQLPDMTTLLILAQALTEKGEKTVCAIDDVLQDWAPSKANTLYALEQSLARTILALNDVIKQVNVLAFGTSVSAPANNYALNGYTTTLGATTQTHWCSPLSTLGRPAYTNIDVLTLAFKKEQLYLILKSMHEAQCEALKLSALLTAMLHEIKHKLLTCPRITASYGLSASSPFGSYADLLGGGTAEAPSCTALGFAAPPAYAYSNLGAGNYYSGFVASAATVASLLAGAACDYRLQSLLAQVASTELLFAAALKRLGQLNLLLQGAAFPSTLSAGAYWGA